MKTKAITLAAFFLLSGMMNAQQVPTKLWVDVFDGVSRKSLGMATPILDRHGILWGTATYQNAAGGTKIAPICFSASGATTLFEVYDSASAGTIVGTAMTLDDTQGVYVTGINYPSNTQTEAILIRYFPSGLIDWVRHFPVYATACRIALDSAGNIILGISGNHAINLWKVNQAGAVVDSGVFRGDTVSLDLGSLVVADSGNVFVMCSRTWSYYEPPGMPILFVQPQLMKVDSHCHLVWEKHTGLPKLGGARRDDHGNLVGFSSGGVAKVSRDGQLLWQTPFASEMQLMSMVVDSHSRVIVCGYGTGESSYNAITCYDADGSMQWAYSLSNAGPTREQFWSVALDSADNIYVTGNGTDGSPGIFWPTVKLNPEGNKIWETRFIRTIDVFDGGTYIAVDKSGDIYAVGSFIGSLAGGLIVIKYSQAVTTVGSAFGQDIPDHHVLQQNYPNPFNPRTRITYQLSKECDVRLTVFDLLGREVAVLEQGKMPPGTHTVLFDGSNLGSGVYFCCMKAAGVVTIKKMTIIR